MFDVDYIIKLIEKKGYSCSKVEKSLGFGNGTIRRWKQSSPSINKLYALSEFLSVSICDVLNENPEFPDNSIDKKVLNVFHKLNEDNQDIIIGEIKKLLKEQRSNEK